MRSDKKDLLMAEAGEAPRPGSKFPVGWDMVAVAFSIAALALTFIQWHGGEQADKEDLAARYCEDYFTGPKLAQQFQAIKGWDRKVPMPEAVNRAYGDVFNYLAVVAMRWRRESVDTSLLRSCMSVAFIQYCDPAVFIQPDGIKGRWEDLNVLVTNVGFWANRKPAEQCAATLGLPKPKGR